jgi:hypothetical protein
MGNQEPLGLPQESHIIDPPPLDQRVIKIGNKHLSPQSPLSCGIIAPYNSSPCSLAANDVCIINNDQNITFLGHTGLLIIVWALWPLNNVTIHYLKWGFKTRGVTIEPHFFSPWCKVVLKSPAIMQLFCAPISLILIKDSQHSIFPQ